MVQANIPHLVAGFIVLQCQGRLESVMSVKCIKFSTLFLPDRENIRNYFLRNTICNVGFHTDFISFYALLSISITQYSKPNMI